MKADLLPLPHPLWHPLWSRHWLLRITIRVMVMAKDENPCIWQPDLIVSYIYDNLYMCISVYVRNHMYDNDNIHRVCMYTFKWLYMFEYEVIA